jgi:hypothetical protein
MSKPSIPYFASVFSIPQQIYQTAVTCATRSSAKILLDREVPSQERCSLPCSTWPSFIRITGLRCAEYAQKTQSTFDEHKYPSGKRVVTAFIPTGDWKFYGGSDSLVRIHTLKGDLKVIPKKLKVTFHIQKNRQNGQSIKLVADDAHPDICPVRAAYQIFLQSKRLGQSDSEPMGVFVNKFRITR